MIACLRAYKELTGARLLIIAWPGQANAPFDHTKFKGVGDVNLRTQFDGQALYRTCNNFCPSAVLVSGWQDKGYINICRRLKKQGVPVVSGLDTQWNGCFRQKIASLVAPIFTHQFIDIFWGCGDRQRIFANKFGYLGDKFWDGFYSCESEVFSRSIRANTLKLSQKKFLFVGRYVTEKGIKTLIEAYKLYRFEVAEPWNLMCAGTGPLGKLLNIEGVENYGFVQPAELPQLFAEASAFVLPSLFEPWGVVVHEAASSKLPLILSNACGSGDHLLEHTKNGFKVETGSVQGLTDAMLAFHHLADTELQEFGERSYQLSLQYSPEIWAQTLYTGLNKYYRALNQSNG